MSKLSASTERMSVDGLKLLILSASYFLYLALALKFNILEGSF